MTRRPGRWLAGCAVALMLLAQPVAAADLCAPTPRQTLQWRGEEHWRLVLDDGEAGDMRIGFIQTPAGDYLLSGDLLLDDARLGINGTACWDGNRLILDLTTLGAVIDVPPEPAKRNLYPEGQVPDRISSAGFAMLRAVLDRATLGGRTVQYQVNVVTGDHVQGPVLRTGRLERVHRP